MKKRILSAALLLGAIFTGWPGVQAAQPSSQAAVAPVFATVSGKVISAMEYENAVNAAARQKFYHGKPPEAEVDALFREVGDKLIERILLADEAARRRIKPDAKKIDEAIAGYEARYKDSAQWKQNRERLLPGLREKLEQQDVIEQLEASVRKPEKPGQAEVRAYYDSHPDLFTEPEKLHLAVILLKVDPSSPKLVWDKAEEEARQIAARLKKGANFGELAKLHSGDTSAEKGGDLGYLHRGMLPEALQDKIDDLKPDSLSEPVRVLEGVGLFRMIDRKPAQKRGFNDVSERAADLLVRERSEAAWKNFTAGLRKQARVEIDTKRYPKLAASR